MPTPHINAEPGDFADVCLLPGDPLRAKHIADTFLFDHRQVTDVRNMLGFTGTYRGRTVSVMGSGMGVPSASIYYKELITEYGVDKLIRVGSCGGISEAVGMRDVILASGGCTDSQVNRTRFGGWDFAAVADFGLLSAAAAAAEAGECACAYRERVHRRSLLQPDGRRNDGRMRSDGSARRGDGNRRPVRRRSRVRRQGPHHPHGQRSPQDRRRNDRG